MKDKWNIKKFKEDDRERSGPLTPENGETYDYFKGEPKYYHAYKVGYEHLKTLHKKIIGDINNASFAKGDMSPYQFDELMEIINSRFGVKKRKYM